MSQVVFSGIKPSGSLHIGNYLGAIKQFAELQHAADAIFCIVDMHAITVPHDPAKLRKRTLDIASLYIAAGIDPDCALIFVQSHVPAHAELGWILNTFTPVGELQRMTQYKDAIAKGKPTFAGLLNYPTLMAADILLYQTNKVPVGEDQVQHIELTRSIAERFNNRYGDTFTLPEPQIYKESSRIRSLANPEQKMSKSETDPKGTIEILDTPSAIRKKIKEAVTDSGSEILYDPKTRPAISNLLTIYQGFSGMPMAEIEALCAGKSYTEFKKDLAEVMITELEPIQKKFKELEIDKAEVMKIMKENAGKTAALAGKTLREVRQKVGFLGLE